MLFCGAGCPRGTIYALKQAPIPIADFFVIGESVCARQKGDEVTPILRQVRAVSINYNLNPNIRIMFIFLSDIYSTVYLY